MRRFVKSVAGAVDELFRRDEASRKPDIRPGAPSGINVIGYTYSETGVGELARRTLYALDTVGCPVMVYPLSAHDLSRKGDTSVEIFDEGAEHPVNIFHVNADMTFVVKDHLPPEVYRKRHNIAFWNWELSDFPLRWRDCIDVYDEIWVASTFIQRSIAPYSPVPVLRMPVSVDVPVPEGVDRRSFNLPGDAFIFLFMFDALSVIERKNPWDVMRAYEAAFTEKERQGDVRLVIKATNLDRFPDEARRLRDEMKRLNGVLLESYLDRPVVNALIQSCDAYVSLHRSEGFGLTIAEAMCLAKPVITTAYSGNTDFTNVNNSYLVPYRLAPLAEDYPPYDRGNVWAVPDWEAAARHMRDIYENPEEAARRGERAAAYIRDAHSLRQTGHFIVHRLEHMRNHSE